MTGTFQKTAVLLGLVGSLLAGCSSHTERDFLCSAQEGTPCASISAIDGTGASGARSLQELPEDTAVKSLSQKPLSTGKGGTGRAHPDGGFPYNAARYRSPELVGTLWIAPVMQESGILEEARFVHFVIREGSWKK